MCWHSIWGREVKNDCADRGKATVGCRQWTRSYKDYTSFSLRSTELDDLDNRDRFLGLISLHCWQTHTSGTLDGRTLAQDMWIHTKHLEHSIMGRPAAINTEPQSMSVRSTHYGHTSGQPRPLSTSIWAAPKYHTSCRTAIRARRKKKKKRQLTREWFSAEAGYVLERFVTWKKHNKERGNRGKPKSVLDMFKQVHTTQTTENISSSDDAVLTWRILDVLVYNIDIFAADRRLRTVVWIEWVFTLNLPLRRTVRLLLQRKKKGRGECQIQKRNIRRTASPRFAKNIWLQYLQGNFRAVDRPAIGRIHSQVYKIDAAIADRVDTWIASK